MRYPQVHNMADAGEVIAAPIGREFLGAAQVCFLVFSCGGHALTGMIAFDTSMLRFWLANAVNLRIYHPSDIWCIMLSALGCGYRHDMFCPHSAQDTQWYLVPQRGVLYIDPLYAFPHFCRISNRADQFIAAVLITMIGVGIIGHQGGVTATANLSFSSGFLVVTDIVRTCTVMSS